MTLIAPLALEAFIFDSSKIQYGANTFFARALTTAPVAMKGPDTTGVTQQHLQPSGHLCHW